MGYTPAPHASILTSVVQGILGASLISQCIEHQVFVAVVASKAFFFGSKRQCCYDVLQAVNKL